MFQRTMGPANSCSQGSRLRIPSRGTEGGIRRAWSVVVLLSMLALLLNPMASRSVAADAAATPVIVAEPTLAPATPPDTGAADPSVTASPPAHPCAVGASAPPVLDVGAVDVTNAARRGQAYAPALVAVDLAVSGATTACGDRPWRLRLTAFSLTNGEASYPPTLIESGGTASSGEVSIRTVTDVASLPIVATGQGDGVIHLTLSITLPAGAPAGDYRGSIGLSLEPDP